MKEIRVLGEIHSPLPGKKAARRYAALKKEVRPAAQPGGQDSSVKNRGSTPLVPETKRNESQHCADIANIPLLRPIVAGFSDDQPQEALVINQIGIS
ncbi:MAG: hypothetical protein WBH04_08830 [Albidovulum sp.]